MIVLSDPGTFIDTFSLLIFWILVFIYVFFSISILNSQRSICIKLSFCIYRYCVCLLLKELWKNLGFWLIYLSLYSFLFTCTKETFLLFRRFDLCSGFHWIKRNSVFSGNSLFMLLISWKIQSYATYIHSSALSISVIKSWLDDHSRSICC